jgi:mannan endo-1,4-beta-mannosidase
MLHVLKNYVSHALNRTNHYSGVKYKNDPTIPPGT